jgi:flagellar biosynthetic protein FlhB
MGAGGQRTEPATPRRRQEARRKGQVARTAELGPALMLLVVYAVFSGRAGSMAMLAQRLMKQGLSAMADAELLNANQLNQLVVPLVMIALQILAPLFVGVVGVALVSQLVQVGILFSTETLKPRWDKLNPINGLQRLFSKRALIELVKSLLKVGFIGYLSYRIIRFGLQELPLYTSVSPEQSFTAGSRLIGQLAKEVGIAFIALAAADYIYQRWEYELSIRMTRKEVEDELKQTEGDPYVRGKIRQRQRQMALRRMMSAVPQADVVVTNPTHLAVALRYDVRKNPAPVVVAKGAGLLAERIKALAKEHRVPIVENVELAQALYHGVEIDGPVPAQFYQAVAEVLAFVYRLKGKTRH